LILKSYTANEELSNLKWVNLSEHSRNLIKSHLTSQLDTVAKESAELDRIEQKLKLDSTKINQGITAFYPIPPDSADPVKKKEKILKKLQSKAKA